MRRGPALLLAFACGWPQLASAERLGGVEFTRCELPGKGSPLVTARCARIEVAENPGLPDGRRIALAVAWLPARDRKPLADAVMFLAGGPGQSARESYAAVLPALDGLRRHRHVILVDQRGTGESNRLSCPLADWRDPAQAGPAAARQQALACREQLQSRADLSRYSTGDAVRDLETVRRRLGIAQFNLVGGSYGTRVALEYLRRHPASVRSLVLDSVVPPELPLLQDHARNLDAALARQFQRCRDTAACVGRFGDPQQALEQLLARTAQDPRTVALYHPNTHEPVAEPLNADLVRGVVRLFAYTPETAALLPLLLAEALAGRPEALIAQAGMVADELGTQLAHGMELSVVCAEDEPFLRARPEDARSTVGDGLTALLRAQCAEWPRATIPADFKLPVVSDVPALLLAGELDPVTPPAYAAAVARHLSRGRVLLAPGQGHLVMTRGCLPRLLRSFIDNPDTARDAAGLDARCLDVLGPAPPFESWLGPAP